MSENMTNTGLVDRILTAKQVADLIGSTHGTIRAWDSKGIGPKSFKMNGSRRWRQSTVLDWLAAQEAASNGPDAA
ncbi:hypothetical protein nbrc107696_01510 [Gordonia spumicola]|uniref:Helix-turn-helix domain-containing protein n=1 Tax=Gordonia spumicola TaxID=589161 RepID=A0A7I9V2S1_9ACTN|nr:DNA-binding protein [Gordonia spumicola]GED99704.1 hypothetical protein nbrc107696_01510 [Gordonia spumicola]